MTFFKLLLLLYQYTLQKLCVVNILESFAVNVLDLLMFQTDNTDMKHKKKFISIQKHQKKVQIRNISLAVSSKILTFFFII